MYFIKPEIIVNKLTNEIKKISQGKILILTNISKKNYIKDILENSINKTVETIFIDDVKPENPFSYIKDVYERLNFQPTNIIAIGGGSVIDLAKALSVSISYEELKNNFYGINKSLKKHSQVTTFPATFGTGAEISYGAILYDDERGLKGGIRGEIVQSDKIVLDFSLYHSAPKHIKALAGFDCLTHCVETYVSVFSDEVTRYHAVKSLETVFDNLELAVNDDKEATKNMAIASMMMGLNLAFSSTCIPHRIQYVIGPMTKTSHAEGLTALYKGWLQFIAKNGNGAFFYLAKDLSTTVDKLKIKIESLKKNLEVDYSLIDLGINEKDIDIIVEKTSGNLKADPYYINKSSIEEVLKLSL
jgi:alcohol dehydrogenase class IV